MNCLKISLVGVAARAGAAEQGAAGPSAAAAGAVGAGAAGAENGAREPKSVSKAVKPLDSVDLLEPKGADPLDIAGTDPLETPWVAAPRTAAQRLEGAISSGDRERNSLPFKRAG